MHGHLNVKYEFRISHFCMSPGIRYRVVVKQFPTNGKTEVLHHQGLAVFVSTIYNTINIVCKFVTDNFWHETVGEVHVKRMLFSITKSRVWSFPCFQFPTDPGIFTYANGFFACISSLRTTYCDIRWLSRVIIVYKHVTLHVTNIS
jgi:hypothetical protein